MVRIAELLDAAADALDDNRDPFHESFLIEHDVTVDEVFALSAALALAARLVAAGIENPAVMRGAVNGAAVASTYQALNRALERL